MALTVAIQMDPIEKIDIAGDSTFALALEAQNRGHGLLYYGPRDLTFRDGKVTLPVILAQARGSAADQAFWRDAIEENTAGVHLLGTARMGNDAATSVVDKFHRTHDVPNLFLCDGSSFVTSGRGQPTMTIQALAFRAADHIGRFAKLNQV